MRAARAVPRVSSATVSRLASVGMDTSRLLARSRRAAVVRTRPGRARSAPATVHRVRRGRRTPRGGEASSCLGVLAGVPGGRSSRSGPTDQAPTVRRRRSRWRRSAGAGCLRRSVVIRLSASAPGRRDRGPSPRVVGWAGGQAAAAAARRAGTSTRMPGPIVVAIVRLLRYWPLAPAGPGAVDGVDQRRQVVDELRPPRSWPCRTGRG